MHNFTWRLDIDLNGADNNSAYWTKHTENLAVSPSTAMDEMDLISVEGSRVWNPQKFNTLEIFDCFPEGPNCSTLENGNGRPTSYELVPMRSGTARHSELENGIDVNAFTQKDFWITLYNPNQILANKLPDYISNPPQSTVNKDLVVWYTGSEHHENDSRDEDKNTVEVLWTGFELIPHNLFNHTPFYPNP